MFKSIDKKILKLLVDKYGSPKNYEITFNETGIYYLNGECYNIFDDSMKFEDLIIGLIKDMSIGTSNGIPYLSSINQEPVIQDKYAYESNMDYFMDYYLYDND